ncbi:TonB C-terminal domain-containing protein [Myxococcota bacterium]|nr:TonB C-terminal domain-containing protein [Myxococcota bacterium]
MLLAAPALNAPNVPVKVPSLTRGLALLVGPAGSRRVNVTSTFAGVISRPKLGVALLSALRAVTVAPNVLPALIGPTGTPEKPKEAAKPEPQEKPAEKPPPKPAEKDLSYEDAMKSLDEELGEDETEDLLARAPARPNVRRSTEASGASQSSSGVKIDPALAAWYLETKRLIQSKWVTPANFVGRGLQTVMELKLSASGALIGEPVVVRTSGDPYFDDNAVRAVLSVAPLPPTPKPGKTIFIFSAEEL